MNIWGFLGVVHILCLIASALLMIGLYFLLKHVKPSTARLVLGILSLSGISAILYNLIAWNSPIEYLPFHLCSIGAILLPLAIITKSHTLGNLLLVWCVGALFADVFNAAHFASADVFWSWTNFFFFVPHVLEFAIPILMIKLKLVEKKPRYILSSLGITAIIYTVVHFINLGLNAYCVNANITDWKGDLVQVNYMYSLNPDFPILEVFHRILPYDYWYMLLVFPIVGIYLVILYAKEILSALRARKKT